MAEKKWLYLSIIALLIISIFLFITLKNVTREPAYVELTSVDKDDYSPSSEENPNIGRTVECTQHSQCPGGICGADFKCTETLPGDTPLGLEEFRNE